MFHMIWPSLNFILTKYILRTLRTIHKRDLSQANSHQFGLWTLDTIYDILSLINIAVAVEPHTKINGDLTYSITTIYYMLWGTFVVCNLSYKIFAINIIIYNVHLLCKLVSKNYQIYECQISLLIAEFLWCRIHITNAIRLCLPGVER